MERNVGNVLNCDIEILGRKLRGVEAFVISAVGNMV